MISNARVEFQMVTMILQLVDYLPADHADIFSMWLSSLDLAVVSP
jgi:hypothetical protein